MLLLSDFCREILTSAAKSGRKSELIRTTFISVRPWIEAGQCTKFHGNI